MSINPFNLPPQVLTVVNNITGRDPLAVITDALTTAEATALSKAIADETECFGADDVLPTLDIEFRKSLTKSQIDELVIDRQRRLPRSLMNRVTAHAIVMRIRGRQAQQDYTDQERRKLRDQLGDMILNIIKADPVPLIGDPPCFFRKAEVALMKTCDPRTHEVPIEDPHSAAERARAAQEMARNREAA